MVSAALTDIAGSSDVFSAGFVTYSGHAKRTQLDVSSEILETFGEVALATAWAMAAGALANSDADVAVAITGIAGPGGGSARKPVGRSEEHTSELQSLMRNSYAVFCLKKKKQKQIKQQTAR